MSIKIAITYEKGGVAKTTTAVNVSAIIAERGYKVLLIDLDPQSYATSYYNLYSDELPSISQLPEDNEKSGRTSAFGENISPVMPNIKSKEDDKIPGFSQPIGNADKSSDCTLNNAC